MNKIIAGIIFLGLLLLLSLLFSNKKSQLAETNGCQSYIKYLFEVKVKEKSLKTVKQNDEPTTLCSPLPESGLENVLVEVTQANGRLAFERKELMETLRVDETIENGSYQPSFSRDAITYFTTYLPADITEKSLLTIRDQTTKTVLAKGPL